MRGYNMMAKIKADVYKVKPIDLTSPEENSQIKNTFLRELIKHEDYRSEPYLDVNGNVTGGVGHLFTELDYKRFDPNWDKETKDKYWVERFQEDMLTSALDVSKLVANWETKPNKEQREILINMRFNMGNTGLRKFKNMIKALSKGDKDTAADEMINSKWHRDFVKWNSKKDASTLRSRELEAKMRNS